MPDLSGVIKRSIAAATSIADDYTDALMVHTLLIQRTQAVGTLNYTTGLLTDNLEDVYRGPGYASRVSGGDPVVLGDEMVFFDTVTGKVPIEAANIRIDDILTILATPDTHCLNRAFRINSVTTNIVVGPLGFTAVGIAPSRSNKTA